MRKIFSIFLINFSLLFLCVAVHSAEEFVSISGRISRSSAAGVSLNDITIDVTGTSNMRVKTDRYGNYIIHGLPKGGTYTLTISKEGYSFSPNAKTYRALTESKINENFIATVSNYSISGRVLVGGKPVRGATIMISQRNIKYITDYNGAYVIDNLEYDGPYTVSVISDEHYFEPFTVAFLDKDITHDFEKDIYASGRVTSLGQSVANIEIDVNGVKYKTDDQGFYKVKGLKTNGDYIINISNSANFTVTPKSIPIKKVTQDEEDLNFSVLGYISGNVTYNGKPFADAVIKISGREKEYKTNVNGYYKIEDLGITQEYNLSISSTGYSFDPQSRTIKNLITESNSQDFKASILKYKVNITVIKGKTPVKDAEISVNGSKDSFKTNENGKCEIKLNYGKEYNFSVRKQGYSFVESKKTIKNLGNDSELSFEALLSISGTVKTANAPLKDAVVSYGDKLSVKTNKDGKYIINDLKPNVEYKISVSSNNFIFKPETIVINALAEQETDRDFTGENKNKTSIETKIKTDLNTRAEEESKAKTETETLKAVQSEKTADAVLPEPKNSALEAAPAVLTKEEKKRLEKEEKIRLKAEKEEQKRLAKEEKIRLKAEQEEQKRLAKEEARKQALEIEAQKIAAEETEINKEEAKIKAEKEAEKIKKEQESAELNKTEASASVAAAATVAEGTKTEELQLTKEEKKRLEKEEKIRLKAEKEEQKRLAKEEKIRLKAEQEEQKRLAKEEARKQALEIEAQKIAEKEAEQKRKEELKAQAEQEAQAKKEEAIRLKAEKAEQDRLAKEAEQKQAEEAAKIKAEQEAQAKQEAEKIKKEQESAELNKTEASASVAAAATVAEGTKTEELQLTKEEKKRLEKEEKIRLKAEKEEQKRLAKEEKIRLKAEQEEQKRLAKEEARKQALEIETQKIAEKEAALKKEEERIKEAEAKTAKIEKEETVLQSKEVSSPTALTTSVALPVVLTKEEKKRLEKEEKIRLKAEKEEQKRLAKEEKIRLKAEQEEQKRLAKEEARKQALEIEAQKIAEKEAEQKRKEELKAQAEQEAQAKKEEAIRLKAEKAEQDRLAKEAEQKQAEEAAKIKAEQEAQAKQEAEKLKAEQAEKDRLAKEAEQKQAEEAAKIKAEQEAQAKQEAEKLKAEQAEKDRLAKEAEQKQAEEAAKIKAEQDAKAKQEAEKLKAEQAEKDRLAKEAEQKQAAEAAKIKAEKDAQVKQEAEKLKAEQAEKDRLAKEAEQQKIDSNTKKFSISGRVLKGKMGVQGVQVRLLIDDEERIYLTDNNGFYKIPDLISGNNYTITVISGKEVLNLSPKTRTYKKVTKNIDNQNFYVIEKINKSKEEIKQQVKPPEVKQQQPEQKKEKEVKKETKPKEDEVDEYGLKNKNGLIQAEIHW